MKLDFGRVVVGIALIFIFGGSGVFSQDKKPKEDTSKDPRKEYNEAERPEENYLARFAAIEVSEKLIKENLEDIYMLKVISSNYKDQGWDKDYQEIYNNYKKGVGLFYKRDVIYSRVELEKNKKAIYELFKKISLFYKDKTETLLNQCADTILNLSLDERFKSDPNRNRTVFNNMMRLRIGYGQMDDAARNFQDNLYPNSIFHYRVAKSYGIKILEDLDPENTKDKYNVDKADNLNRVLNPPKTPAKTTTK